MRGQSWCASCDHDACDHSVTVCWVSYCECEGYVPDPVSTDRVEVEG